MEKQKENKLHIVKMEILKKNAFTKMIKQKKFHIMKNGNVYEKCFYKNGKKEGEYNLYDLNGNVNIKCFYKNGYNISKN